jgi:hypothetical protein
VEENAANEIQIAFHVRGRFPHSKRRRVFRQSDVGVPSAR